MKLTQKERDELIIHILSSIDEAKFSIAGKEKKERWERGWQEILDEYKRTGNPETLIPPYDLRPAKYMRWEQDYVIPEDPFAEIKWRNEFRTHVFSKYLKDADSIYEFGCGTGQNLLELKKLFPEKELYGLEWVSPAVELINLLGFKGLLFDMFAPDSSLNFAPNSAVLTRASLEQMGSDFMPFLEFLLKKKPSLVVHIEPILELYDENNLSDHLAIKFHKKRNYLEGYLPALQELEGLGVIEILEVKRVKVGSLFLDPYSLIVWKPK